MEKENASSSLIIDDMIINNVVSTNAPDYKQENSYGVVLNDTRIGDDGTLTINEQEIPAFHNIRTRASDYTKTGLVIDSSIVLTFNGVGEIIIKDHNDATVNEVTNLPSDEAYAVIGDIASVSDIV